MKIAKKQDKVIEQYSKSSPSVFDFKKVNTKDSMAKDILKLTNITSVPTVMIVKNNGDILYNNSGFISLETLDLIAKNLRTK